MDADRKHELTEESRREQQAAWGAMSTVMSGVMVWGGAGWLVSRWLDHDAFIVLGLLLGMGAALYLVWVRYGKA